MSQLKDYQINFINEAMRVGALEFGTFTLKSGRQSPYFFNASKLLFDADINIIIEGFAHKFLEFNSDINQLFGPAYKGTIFGSMLGMHLKKPILLYRFVLIERKLKIMVRVVCLLVKVPLGML